MNDRTTFPSRVRHLVVFVTFLAALLLYLHRFCISYVQQYIKEDLGLTDNQLSWCFSAFFFAYAVAQVPSGFLSDRFGARRMLTTYVLAWSAFTAMLGFTLGFIMLLVLRVAVGISQAGAYPTSAALVGRWSPISARGKANSFIAFGGRMGGFLAPLLTVYLVVFFVPPQVPSEISQEDFLDVHFLCFQMVEADLNRADEAQKDSVGSDLETAPHRRVRARVFARLSSESKQIAQRLANKYEMAARERIDEDETEKDTGEYNPAASRSLVASAADIQALQNDLNAVLNDGDFYHATSKEISDGFMRISLEKEAKTLAAMNTRSDDETRRLNRLLIEAVFSESVRKVYVHGWRKVMFIYGLLGLVVAGLFWFSFRDRPAVHPRCNAQERSLIEAGRTEPASDNEVRHGGVPIKAMLKSRSLCLMCVNQFGGNVGWVFLLTWLPRYLREVHSVPFVERGWMAAVPLGVGWMGMLLGGWLTDHLTGRFGLRWRTAPIILGRFAAAAAYLCCMIAPSAWTATAAFAVIAFSNDLGNPSSWAYKQDVGGLHVGAIHGWANMWGNFGAAMSPVFLQLVISRYSWNAAFLVGAIAFLIAGTATLGVDARVPIFQNEESDNSNGQ